jgi:hypothetical protein
MLREATPPRGVRGLVRVYEGNKATLPFRKRTANWPGRGLRNSNSILRVHLDAAHLCSNYISHSQERDGIRERAFDTPRGTRPCWSVDKEAVGNVGSLVDCPRGSPDVAMFSFVRGKILTAMRAVSCDDPLAPHSYLCDTVTASRVKNSIVGTLDRGRRPPVTSSAIEVDHYQGRGTCLKPSALLKAP